MAGTVSQYQQGAFASPTNGTIADATVVLSNDNTIRGKHNSHDADPTIHVQSSALASRPAAGTAQRVWVTTDGLRAYVDSGAAWGELAYLPLVGGTVTGATTQTGLATFNGGIQVASGQHVSIGGAATVDNLVLVTGAFTGSVNTMGFELEATLTVPVGGSGYGVRSFPTLTRAGSGTHGDFLSGHFVSPTINGGAATVNNTATLKAEGWNGTGTNGNFVIWANNGPSFFDAGQVTGSPAVAGTPAAYFLSANRPASNSTSISVYESTALGANNGGSIGFGFRYASGVLGTTFAVRSGISGYKLNATDGNNAAGLKFWVSANSASDLATLALTISDLAVSTFAANVTIAAGGLTSAGTTKLAQGGAGTTDTFLWGAAAVPTTGYGLSIQDNGSVCPLLRINGTGTALAGVMTFGNANGAVGTIQTNGSATAYNTSSDERLKDLRLLRDVGQLIDSIAVYDAAFTVDPELRYPMFSAQQLYRSAPWSVSVGGDDPKEQPWMVDNSKLVPMLTGEIQSLRARVRRLELAKEAGVEFGLTMEKRPTPTEVAATPAIPT